MSRTATVATLGVGVCVVADALGAPALLIPGLALVLLCVAAEAGVRLVSWRVRLVREPLSAAAEEGSRVSLTTALVGPRALRRSGELAAIVGGDFKPRRWIDGDRVQFSITARRRGLHEIGASQLRFSDPFGLCERTIASSPTELLVLPRMARIARSSLAKLEATYATARAPAASSGELDGIQPVQFHATAGRIHWPSYARTGMLMERRMRAEQHSRPLIVLDGRDAAGEDAFDMAVRAAGSLALALARSGGCSLLLPPERRAHRLDAALGSWAPIHARLALLEPSGALAWEVIGRARLVLWVSASTNAHALAQPAAGSSGYLVCPLPRGAREVLFTVAGCSVQRLGARRRAAVA